MSDTIAEAVLRRDRSMVVAGLIGVTALAWVYLVHLATSMQGMDMAASVTMPLMRPWAATDFFLMFVMWTVMMVAMMVPAAAPMVLLFAGLNRRYQEQKSPLVSASIFLLGYLVVWGGFAVTATVAQWGFHATVLLSPIMASTSPFLGGVLLVAAGVFQWTPFKHSCLRRCRTPLGFLLSEWRAGPFEALRMGLRHGAYCLGCCWLLMSLLFVLGVMNLLWIAALSAFVLAEKVVPAGHRVSQFSGLLLLGWGLWMIVGGLV